MLKIQNEKFQEDGNQDGVYLPDEGESNVDGDGDAEVDAVVYAGVFRDVNLDGGAGVVGDAKAEVYVGVDVDAEVLVGEDADEDEAVDVDVVVVTDAGAEKYANVKVDVYVGVDVDVGLGVSVESGVEVSMHFFVLIDRSLEGWQCTVYIEKHV